MNDISGQIRTRSRAESSQNYNFKSGIFERKQFYTDKQKDADQIKFPIGKNAAITNTSPLSNNSNGKTGAGKQDHNPENKHIWNRQMISSSVFGFQNKNAVGSLFDMARQVTQQYQQNDKPRDFKQKNKLSFLQVPKSNFTRAKDGQNSDFRIKSSSIFNPSKDSKAPSFLKKDTRSSYDPSEGCMEVSAKKQQAGDNSLTNNKTNFPKLEAQQGNTLKAGTTNCQPFSPLPIRDKVSNISPINYTSQYGNRCADQLQQCPSNSKNLSIPGVIPQRSRRSSMIVQNHKDFYTPTQKNTARPGSSIFVQNNDKNNSTVKCSNTTKFIQINDQSSQKGQPYFTSRNQQRKSKTIIPSFIKFKEKRNQIMNKSTIQTKNCILDTNNSIESFQDKKLALDNFQIKQRLGKGAFGDVFLARQSQSGFFCVLKKMSKKKIKQQKLQELIVRQIKIQTYLTHKHLTNLYGFFDDQEHIYLVMEYLSDGSLAQRYNRKKCPQKQVASYVRQICQGLKFMHIQSIIHRDIKPQNVFIHQDYIKIGDFGCSVCSDSKRNTVVGCLAYISPEQLNNQSYDDMIDVWSVGILCYELLTGRPPFEDDIIKIARQEKQAKLSVLRFPTKLELSDDAKDFTKRLLEQIPENRMTIGQALRHPFILKNNIAENLIGLSQAGLRQN